MSSRFWRVLAVLFVLTLLSPRLGSATNIKTRRGEYYQGVQILRRDGTSIEISGPKGKLKLPLASIAEIDGIQLVAAPVPASTAPAVAMATASPAGSAATPAAGKVAGTPSAQPFNAYGAATPFVSSTPAGLPVEITATPRAAGAADNSTMSADPSAAAADAPWTLDAPWIPYAVAVVAGLWIVTLVLVGLDLRKRTDKAWWWLAIAAALPFVGYVAYLLTHRKPVFKGRTHTKEELAVEFQFLDENNNLIAIKSGPEASGIQNAKDILNDALLDRASDVHIEPSGKEYRVRFRVDGVLYPRMKFGTEEGTRLVSAIKSLAQIDIAERRKAQDGRMGGRRGPREVDFRVATTPSVIGEKLVVRILDSKTGLRGLNELGMTEEMMKKFSEIIHSRSGMILATGPTGSGKTSTLYAALTQLDAVGLNLVTIEDPVEYQLAGATQIPVNIRAGITYESGLRSVLRQDPDVILVGEMRDKEAAQIALRSALTGHLVFSTLHTNNAIGTIMRLEEIGIERHLLASSLFVVIAQRLVRLICPHCREGHLTTGQELVDVGIELPADTEIFVGKGCRRCDGTGYLGRTGVFEMLVIDEQLREAISSGAGELEMYEMAHRKGFRNYREDAAMKLLLGVTTVDEVLKAV